jgi:Peptidase C13 family
MHSWIWTGLNVRRIGAVLLVAILSACQSLPQELVEHQGRQLEAQLQQLQATSNQQTNYYFLGLGLSSAQDVFLHDVESARDLFDKQRGTAGRSLVLMNQASSSQRYSYADMANVRRALQGIAAKMHRENDVLVLFVSSHGTAANGGSLEMSIPGLPSTLITGGQLRRALDDAGIKRRAIVISACHSASLIGALQTPYSAIYTAARADRASFGCSFSSLHTYFSEAWLFEGMAKGLSLPKAFAQAQLAVAKREKENLLQSVNPPSEPQASIGAGVAQEVEQWLPVQHSVSAWAAPVFSHPDYLTRRFMGDWYATFQSGGESYSAVLKIAPQAANFKDRMVTYRLSIRGTSLAVSGTTDLPKTGDTFKLYLRRPITLTLAPGSALQEPTELIADWPNAMAGDVSVPEKLRFERVGPLEAAARAGILVPSAERAKATSKIQFVMMGARDCVWCDRWEAAHTKPGGPTALLNLPGFSQIDYIKVQRATLAKPFVRSDFPAALHAIFDQGIGDAKSVPVKRNARWLDFAPGFLLIVDGKIRMDWVGMFDDLPVYPVLRAVVAEKLKQGAH